MRNPARFAIVSAAALLVGACDAPAPTAPGRFAPDEARKAVVVNEQRVPIDRVYDNPCTGEPIAFSGYLRTVITATDDNRGGVHLEVQVNETSLTGVGPLTGNVYRASSELHQSYNTAGAAPLETTVVDNFRIIGQAEAPEPNDDFYMYMRFHLTTNANGTQTADVAETKTECR